MPAHQTCLRSFGITWRLPGLQRSRSALPGKRAPVRALRRRAGYRSTSLGPQSTLSPRGDLSVRDQAERKRAEKTQTPSRNFGSHSSRKRQISVRQGRGRGGGRRLGYLSFRTGNGFEYGHLDRSRKHWRGGDFEPRRIGHRGCSLICLTRASDARKEIRGTSPFCGFRGPNYRLGRRWRSVRFTFQPFPATREPHPLRNRMRPSPGGGAAAHRRDERGRTRPKSN